MTALIKLIQCSSNVDSSQLQMEMCVYIFLDDCIFEDICWTRSLYFDIIQVPQFRFLASSFGFKPIEFVLLELLPSITTFFFEKGGVSIWYMTHLCLSDSNSFPGFNWTVSKLHSQTEETAPENRVQPLGHTMMQQWTVIHIVEQFLKNIYLYQLCHAL